MPQEVPQGIVQGMTQEIPGLRIPPAFSRGQLLGVSSAQEHTSSIRSADSSRARPAPTPIASPPPARRPRRLPRPADVCRFALDGPPPSRRRAVPPSVSLRAGGIPEDLGMFVC